jgi:hypothetical protein
VARSRGQIPYPISKEPRALTVSRRRQSSLSTACALLTIRSGSEARTTLQISPRPTSLQLILVTTPGEDREHLVCPEPAVAIGPCEREALTPAGGQSMTSLSL